MPKLLGESEVEERLKSLRGWRLDGAHITKAYRFRRFTDGIAFVDEVAKVAEKEEHHPDIHVRYTTVTLSLQTHSEGGVTEWDIELARAIQRLGGNPAGQRATGKAFTRQKL